MSPVCIAVYIISTFFWLHKDLFIHLQVHKLMFAPIKINTYIILFFTVHLLGSKQQISVHLFLQDGSDSSSLLQ